MTEYYCSCCDKKFVPRDWTFIIRDGKRLIHLHQDCVLVLSGGWRIESVEEKCEVTRENDVLFSILGSIIYYKPGVIIIHREDGPAIEHLGGRKEWFLEGNSYVKENYTAEMRRRNK